MTFSFDTKNSGRISGFFNDITKDEKKKIAGTFSIKNSDRYIRTVRVDTDGKLFFTWNKEKIMLDDFICHTPEEFVKAIEECDDNSRVYGDELCRTLLKYGMGSLHVMIKRGPLDYMEVGDMKFGFERKNIREEEKEWIEYTFTPEYLHKPINNYKLKMVPFKAEDAEYYGYWDTYVDDMVSLFKHRKDIYKVIVGTKDKKESENVA